MAGWGAGSYVGNAPERMRCNMPTFDCPTCRKTLTVASKEDAPFRPFCCERCKMVDLGRWLDGTYCISEPATPDEIEDAESADSDA